MSDAAKKHHVNTAWGWFGVVVGVGVAILAMIILGGTLIQMAIDSGASSLAGIGNSMNQLGVILSNFSGSIRAVMGGLARITITVALYAVIILGIGFITAKIISGFKKSYTKKEGG